MRTTAGIAFGWSVAQFNIIGDQTVWKIAISAIIFIAILELLETVAVRLGKFCLEKSVEKGERGE